MSKIVLRMDAHLEVRVGMRVYYDCPRSSRESVNSDRFFKKYRGREGAIIGFPTEYVGPLDLKKRLPGIYYKTGSINVRFDGEDRAHHGLNLQHFVLLSPTHTIELGTPLENQRMGDLPQPIRFYPGDVVRMKNEPMETERFVQHVSLEKDGTPMYELSETAQDREEREAENSKIPIEEDPLFLIPDGRRLEKMKFVSGEEITLVKADNVHWLYTDPSKMQFASPADEILFWSQRDLSETVYKSEDSSYENAREMLEAGVGDLIVRTHEYLNRVLIGHSVHHSVKRLHDCFHEHRDRVRALSLTLKEVPIEDEEEWEELMPSQVHT